MGTTIVENIPQELKDLPHWVLWRQEARDGKLTKIPYQANGQRADSTRPSTWTTFSAALNAYQKTGQFSGIGFVFTPDDPYLGVDLDKCRNLETGEIAPWAREILDRLNSYSEISPSGTGVKVFARGRLPRTEKGETRNRKGSIEFYDCNRYFTLTGLRLSEYPATVEERGPEIEALHTEIFAPSTTTNSSSSKRPDPLSLSDDEIVELARNAKNGAKFVLLWAGDTSEYAGDDSAADLALCAILAFYTGGDPAAIDRIFRRSGLYRGKWEREDYRGRTISKALEGVTEFYSPPDKKKRQKRAKNGASPSPTWKVDSRPVIEVAGGQLPQIVDQAEEMLAQAGGIYQRDRLLVRAVRSVPISPPRGVRRPEGSLVIQPISAPWLADELTRIAAWLKFDARTNKMRPVDCPQRYAETLMARAEWSFPTLLGLIEAPTLRSDGSILDRPGYDDETGLLYDPHGVTFPSIPGKPSQEDAIAALKVLGEILEEFPFERHEDHAVAVSAILTALIRRALRTAPLHGFSAPKMRSGKSLLADVASLIAAGRPASVLSQAKDPEEEKKQLLALLMEGDPIVCIDNIERPLWSDALCSILTQETWRQRLLGINRTATVPTSVTFLATGNNLVLAGDLSCRAIVCYLDPDCDRPEEREFRRDLYKHIPEHRPELVTAGLTILRAYHVAGRPQQPLKPYGGFEQWSGWVRSSLVWLGLPDPCLTRQRVEEGDNERADLRALLSKWHESLGDRKLTLAEFAREIEEKEDLREVVVAIAGSRGGGGINTQKMGYFLRKFANRKENGLKLVKVGKKHSAILWTVQGTPERSSGGGEDGEDGDNVLLGSRELSESPEKSAFPEDAEREMGII